MLKYLEWKSYARGRGEDPIGSEEADTMATAPWSTLLAKSESRRTTSALLCLQKCASRK